MIILLMSCVSCVLCLYLRLNFVYNYYVAFLGKIRFL